MVPSLGNTGQINLAGDHDGACGVAEDGFGGGCSEPFVGAGRVVLADDDEVDLVDFCAPLNLLSRAAFDDFQHHLDVEGFSEIEKSLEAVFHSAAADGGIFDGQTFAGGLDVWRFYDAEEDDLGF